MKSSLGFSLLLILSFAACKQAVDVAPPSVEVLSFTPAPRTGLVCGESSANVFFVESGGTLSFELRFRDNEALSQYKIDIHSNFDCHGHARKTEDWSVLEVIDLSGTEQVVSRSLVVPDDVTAGTYHFQIQAIDQAGNEDPFANYYDIQVTNQRDTVPPTLMVDAPSERSFQAGKGSSLRFAGMVMDNYSLLEGDNGRLLLTYREAEGGNRFTAFEQPFGGVDPRGEAFDLTWEVPATLPAGTYELVLSAYDGVNNESERQRFTVEIGA